jgi:RNA polymerase sigma-70 factor (ECF subfamily)
MADIDHILISRILEGDEKSVNQLINRHGSLAYSIAFKITSNHMEAEEAAQDAFIKALRALPRFKADSSFKTWFYRIVYNTAVSYVRRRKIDSSGMDVINEKWNGQAEQQMEIEKKERNIILSRAIGELQKEEALLISLFYLNEFSISEIAEISGINIANIKVKLFRARKKLAHIIESKYSRELMLTS